MGLSAVVLAASVPVRAEETRQPWSSTDRASVADLALTTAVTLDPRIKGRMLLSLAESFAAYGDNKRAHSAAVAAASALPTPAPAAEAITTGAAALLTKIGEREDALAIVRAANDPAQRARILVRVANEAIRARDDAFFLASVNALRKVRREMPPFQTPRLDVGMWLSTLAERNDMATALALVSDLSDVGDIASVAAVAKTVCHPGTALADSLSARADSIMRLPALAGPGPDLRATAAVEIIAICQSLEAAKAALHATPGDNAASIQFALAGFLRTIPAAYPTDTDDPVLLARSAAALVGLGATAAADEALTRSVTLMLGVDARPGWSAAMRSAFVDMHRDVAIAFADAGRSAAALAALAPVAGMERLSALVQIIRHAAEHNDETGVQKGIDNLVALIGAMGRNLAGAPFQLRALQPALARYPAAAAALEQVTAATFGPPPGPLPPQGPARIGSNRGPQAVVDTLRKLFPSLQATQDAVALAQKGDSDDAIAAASAIRPSVAEAALLEVLHTMMHDNPAGQEIVTAGLAVGGYPGYSDIASLLADARGASPAQGALLAIDRVFVQRSDAAALAKAQQSLPAGTSAADAGLAMAVELAARKDPRAASATAQTIQAAPARLAALMAVLKAPAVAP